MKGLTASKQACSFESSNETHWDHPSYCQVLSVVDWDEVEVALCIRMAPDCLGLVDSIDVHRPSSNLDPCNNLRSIHACSGLKGP